MYKILLTCFIFISLTSKAQLYESEVKTMIENSNEEKLVGESSRFLQENFFHFANMVTDKLLKYDNKNGNYNYRKGYILLEMNMDPEQALNHLLIASKDVNINYDIYSPKEKSAPIDVYYHMGISYHRLGNLDKALENYKKFVDESNKLSNLIAPAKVRIAQVANAKKVLQNPTTPAPVPMSGEVNTSFDELNPIISGDGKSLLFSSTRNRKDNLSLNSIEPMFNELPADIYQQTKNKQNEWSTSELFLLNEPKIDERITSLSVDERKLAYSSWNVSALSSSEFVGGLFTAPIDNKVVVDNGKAKEAPFNMQLNVSTDGKTAYFVSNAITGKGGWDIYMTENVDGKWSAAKNISMINTVSDEMAPYVSLDGKTLYFASNSTESIGGYDIFKSTKDENGMWSKPQNIGYPINSFSDDIAFSMTANGKEGFISTNRIGSTGKNDIFSAEINETPSGMSLLDGRIVSVKGIQLPEQSYMTLKCLDCANATETILTPRMRDGVFMAPLEKCKQYEIAYYYGALTKNPYRNTFKTSCDEAFELITKRVLILEDENKIVPFPTYEIKGVVTDINTGTPIANTSIKLVFDGKKDTQSSKENGLYNSEIIAGYEFDSKIAGNIRAEVDGYLSVTTNIDQDLFTDSVVTVNFQLDATSKCILGPYFVNYQFDRSFLTDYSKNKLKEAIKIMNDNPNLKIEIRSHTDSRGPAIYNQWLSDMRAKVAREYIQANIVNPNRVTSKGLGESELLKPCGDGVSCTEQDHLQNRRTEFIILK
jgi:outer membrane protein OmpA-like peptidoglycan-associated protein